MAVKRSKILISDLPLLKENQKFQSRSDSRTRRQSCQHSAIGQPGHMPASGKLGAIAMVERGFTVCCKRNSDSVESNATNSIRETHQLFGHSLATCNKSTSVYPLRPRPFACFNARSRERERKREQDKKKVSLKARKSLISRKNQPSLWASILGTTANWATIIISGFQLARVCPENRSRFDDCGVKRAVSENETERNAK